MAHALTLVKALKVLGHSYSVSHILEEILTTVFLALYRMSNLDGALVSTVAP